MPTRDRAVKAKGAIEIAFDALIAALVIASLALIVTLVATTHGREIMARAYVSQFAVKDENACPLYFGKPFWFTCASEVRRVNGEAPR